MIDVEITAAPRNGQAQRLVEAKAGERYHRDSFNVDSATSRQRFIKQLASKLDVDPGELSHVDGALITAADEADQLADQQVAELLRDNDTGPAHADQRDDRDRLLDQMSESSKVEARAMLESPNLVVSVLKDIAALGVAGERELVATIYLVGVSRLLAKPLSAIVQGPSASGKSFTIERVASLFPPEAVLPATQMTPQALFHMRPGSLEHRFVVAGERSRIENDERAEATRALREMISGGRLVKLMPIKINGEITTVSIVQNGPIAFIESTTLSKIFDEDANRCLLMVTDERREQTKRIVTSLATHYAGQVSEACTSAIIERHHALQRMLEPANVVVPYAERLAELIAHDKVETRRAFPQMLSMVQAVALLHQRLRKIDSDGRLIADRDDYQLARHLLVKPLGRLLGGKVSDPAARFFDRLKEWATGTAFSTRDAVHSKTESATDRAIRGWLGELADAGKVEVVDPAKGPKPATWRLTDASDHDVHDHDLPPVEALFA